ncbi:hypothetical protein FQN55_009418 [Onygenales sp. PD_40]|nr:hypothetical protein FQN55_009418 [Onygenales sp. PD_40]KAK2777053.1 hypothetical protein FQN52_003236 [Onygenales sp. PD_12]KAK2789445.1 hypothetical protein FQN53_001891 [Emmonsiellopsis sp. PD_33]KAK2795575.1 hypothetical protein FQN51_000429 [Onygenales sp. PD_10]
MTAATKVLQVPKESPSSEILQGLCDRFKTARLRALREDPSAFSSKYETESQFENAFWAKRLQNPLAKTFVAVRTEADRPTQTEDNDLELLARNEWLGMVVLLGPRALAADGTESNAPWRPFLPPADPNQPPDTASIAGSEAAYLAVSMFVLAEARKQGLGRRIIEKSVEAVQREAKSLGASRLSVCLLVEPDNGTAQRLYERCGFVFLPADPVLKKTMNTEEKGMRKVVSLED